MKVFNSMVGRTHNHTVSIFMAPNFYFSSRPFTDCLVAKRGPALSVYVSHTKGSASYKLTYHCQGILPELYYFGK